MAPGAGITPAMTSSRRHAPATERNREPLLQVLTRVLPVPHASGSLLVEVASGTGEHAAYLAPSLPGWSWQPSDPSGHARQSIDAWSDHLVSDTVWPAVRIDASGEWPRLDTRGLQIDAMLCINMIHISPYEATEGLMRGAARYLSARGLLLTYGPYRVDGRQTSDSNVQFEQWLKSKDERYGVRDVAEVAASAESNGLVLHERIAMPANNFVLVFGRR